MVAVDIFRIADGRVVEHWDVMQEEVPTSETASGNPMFWAAPNDLKAVPPPCPTLSAPLRGESQWVLEPSLPIIAYKEAHRCEGDLYDAPESDLGLTASWPPDCLHSRTGARRRDATVLGAGIRGDLIRRTRRGNAHWPRYVLQRVREQRRTLSRSDRTLRHGICRLLSEGTEERQRYSVVVPVFDGSERPRVYPRGTPQRLHGFVSGTHVPPVLTSVRDIMRDVRRYGEELLSARLREGLAQGDLSPDTEVEELAAFFEAALRGMAVKARDGVSVDRLLMIGRAAMRAWPTAEVDEVRK
jgi:hypothetical protein